MLRRLTAVFGASEGGGKMRDPGNEVDANFLTKRKPKDEKNANALIHFYFVCSTITRNMNTICKLSTG